jgi:hypothetical protein
MPVSRTMFSPRSVGSVAGQTSVNLLSLIKINTKNSLLVVGKGKKKGRRRLT